jgi:tripartite-type tricarboxylate transporter receptor subunit TctC
MKKLLSLALGAALLGGSVQAIAADYPSRSVQIVVPFAPGGGGDFIVRTWADKLAAVLKQPVVVENKGGANTIVGSEYVAKAAPDGYTLLFTSTALATNPTLVPSLPYKTPDSFTPVSLVITYPFGLGARRDLEPKTIPELIAYAKKNPGRISIANSGDGSGSHLAAELLKDAAGIELTTVPYKGAGPAATDLAGGHVDLLFTGLSQLKPFVDGDRIKLMATSGLHRVASAPDVPTIAEQGLPGFNAVVWWGLLAPAGTPPDVVAKLNQALRTTLADPDVVKRLAVIDGDVSVSSPKEFDTFIRAEVSRWARLLKPAAKP